MTVEQFIICILTGIIFYLYYLYRKALENKKEDNSIYYFNSRRKEGEQFYAGSSGTQEKRKEDDEEPYEDEEGNKEYNYKDPNFKLAPVIPYAPMKGVVIDENGDAFYGNDKKYYSSLYYGRVSKDAKLELKDRRVYKNEFEINIIKVLVLTNEWDSEVGRIGWVGLEDTSFRDQYNPETGMIE